jgi:prepilin-type N-terminal cleavage/methylation domain-containing protein
MKKRLGFTLVEVLVVVIIIAVLAALVVPRMISQTRKAELAEALQMIGALKRAAQKHIDLGGAPGDTPYANGCAGWQGGGGSLSWSALGLRVPDNSKWHYWVNVPGDATISIEAVSVATCKPYIGLDVSVAGITTWKCNVGGTDTEIRALTGPSGNTIGCTY